MYPLSEIEKEKLVYLGTNLSPNKVTSILHCLKNNVDIFAWSHSDMIEVDLIFAQHRLNGCPLSRPVKQRMRQFHPQRQEVIKDEVAQLFQDEFIREVQYPKWLPNVAIMPKKNGKWRVYVYYSDLNKACPKNTFPLPHID